MAILSWRVADETKDQEQTGVPRQRDERSQTDKNRQQVRHAGSIPIGREHKAARQDRSLEKLLFTLFINLVILAAVESTYRILGLGKQQEVAYDIADWSKSWDSDFYVMSSTDGEHQADINRDGLRDRDHQIENTAGATRIICLGDSVTFGYMVPPSESYPGERVTSCYCDTVCLFPAKEVPTSWKAS